MAERSLRATEVAADGCTAAARVTVDGGLWVTGVVDRAVIAAAADEIDARLASAIASVDAVLGSPLPASLPPHCVALPPPPPADPSSRPPSSPGMC